MGYRIIPASLAIGLTTNEAYTYFCLLAKSDYNTYISHVKLETLSQLTGISKTEYISKHIEKLIKKGLLRKDTQQNIGNKGVFNTVRIIYTNRKLTGLELTWIYWKKTFLTNSKLSSSY